MVPSAQSAAGKDARGPSCDDWTETEVAAATFADTRLHRRFADLLRQLAAGVGTTIPQACGDWAGVKAAYRFLANGRVSEAHILGGHMAATAERFGVSAKDGEARDPGGGGPECQRLTRTDIARTSSTSMPR